MPDAVIIDAVRTPTGKRGGGLSGWHPAELAAHTLEALVKRTGVDPALIEDVIMGCVFQTGSQSLNIARTAALTAGWPESVPGTTVDRQCGSGQQAAHFAAQGVMAGAYDVVVAAGVEIMSRPSVVMGEIGDAFPQKLWDRYRETGLPHQGIGAEMIAAEYGLSRRSLDEFSAESHRRAHEAVREGRFASQLVPTTAAEPGSTEVADETIRPTTTVEVLAGLNPVFKEDGVITAGNSSPISDGASAMLITSAEAAERLGLKPRARFHSFSVVGTDPVTMLKGPIAATQRILSRSGLSVDDIDLFEVNEAFAPVVLAWQRETGADLDRVNVNGGAIALGHALGSSGTRLMTTLLNELERRDAQFGLQTMCEGGGLANATIIERLA